MSFRLQRMGGEAGADVSALDHQQEEQLESFSPTKSVGDAVQDSSLPADVLAMIAGHR